MNVELKTGRNIESWIALAVIGILTVACGWILWPFGSAILWAIIICVSAWPLFEQISVATRGHLWLSSLIMVIILAIIIITPFAIVGMSLASNIAAIADAGRRLLEQGPPLPPDWVGQIPLVGTHLRNVWIELSVSSAARVQELAKLMPAATTLAVKIGKSIGAGILQFILSLVIAYFLFRDGADTLARTATAADKLAGEPGLHALDTAGVTVRAVVYGILGTAIMEGTLAGVGYWIAGIPGPILLGFATFVLSMLPFGAPVIWVPAMLWLYHIGSIWRAAFMLAWGIVVISGSDSVVRPLVISRVGSTPLILVILGVMGGVIMFGFIGLFLGPVLLAVGYGLIVDWTTSTVTGRLQ